jgi:hypothetical protein
MALDFFQSQIQGLKKHWVLFTYFKIAKAVNNDTFSGKHGPWSSVGKHLMKTRIKGKKKT